MIGERDDTVEVQNDGTIEYIALDPMHKKKTLLVQEELEISNYGFIYQGKN